MTRLSPGERVRVRLRKPGRAEDLVYAMTVQSDDGDHVVVEGPFSFTESVVREHFTLDPDDWFIEHFWRTRWYSVKEIQDQRRVRKGWYCDIARPAQVDDGEILTVDLLLDVWRGVGDAAAVVLDEDEFAASGLEAQDPDAARSARAAVAELVAAAAEEFATLL